MLRPSRERYPGAAHDERMSSLLTVFRLLGEVAHVSTLRETGVSDRALRDGVRSGRLRRLRPGWYASHLADAEQVRAVLVHARLGCVTALERLGTWSGTERRTHLHVPTNASRLGTTRRSDASAARPVWHPRTPASRRRDILVGDPALPARVHWVDDVDPASALDWICSPSAALAQAIRCLPPEEAQAVVDSAVAERLLRRRDVERIVAAAPARLGLVVDELSDRLESGAESLFVRRLIGLGHRVEPQFDFGSHGRYDGIIDGCVLYEVDGWRHHSSRSSFVRDRERTLVGQAFGMPLIRPAAAQIADDWPLVAAAVARTVADARRLREADGRAIAS
jgi:hypothetical protein